MRLEQKGWIGATWQKTEHNRDAKYDGITRTGTRAPDAESARWRRLVHLVDRLLLNQPAALP